MKKANPKSPAARALRQRAEKQMRRKHPPGQKALSDADTRALVHELQVHQVEMEMQNEELLRTQAAAQKAADKYTELFDFGLAGHFVLDARGVILEVNLAGAALLGLARNRVIAKPFHQYLVRDSRPEFDRFCRSMRKNERKQTCELKILKRGHAPADVLVEGIATEVALGEGRGWRLAVMDIAARKRVEVALRDSEARLTGIVGSAMDAIISVGADQKIVFFNAAAAAMFGCSIADAIGQPLDRFIPVRWRARHRQHVHKFGATGVTGRTMGALGSLRALRADGEEFPIEASISHGEVNHQKVFTVILRDITEHERDKAALQKANEVLEQRVAERTAELREKARVLQEGEARYHSLVTASAQIVWTTNALGEVAEDLPAWRSFTGQTAAEIKGWGWAGALHPEDREQTRAVWSQAVAARSLYETEYRVRRRDGEYRSFAVRGVPILDPAGQLREWVGTCTDITDSKAAEERRNVTHALLELFARKASSQDYLEAVVEVIRGWIDCQCLGIRVVDEQGRVPYRAAVGFDPEFLQLENQLSLKSDTCCCLRAISQATEEHDRPLRTPGGSYRCDNAEAFLRQLSAEEQAQHRGNCVDRGLMSVAIIPIRFRDQVLGAVHLADRRLNRFPLASVQFLESMTPLIGEALHRFQTEAELAKHRDHLEELVAQRTAELEAANAQLQTEVSHRKEVEVALRQTAAELQRSNRDLDEFASVASHDLQEPLRAVSGFVKLLQQRLGEKLDAKALEYIAGATDGAERMERLIGDLLALSRVGSRGGRLEPAPLDGLLEAALANLQTSIRETRATVTREGLPTLPVDATQVMQLFQNLVGNALKFRAERPPEIHVGAREEPGRWLVWVRDNGIGMEPKYFERIFQVFQRLHTRKQYPGTGIGLAICKKIVERHGGSIWVESQPGQGATFYFAFPSNYGIQERTL